MSVRRWIVVLLAIGAVSDRAIAVFREVDSFSAGQPQLDDQTLVVVRVS
jgi:hypothetical protein